MCYSRIKHQISKRPAPSFKVNLVKDLDWDVSTLQWISILLFHFKAFSSIWNKKKEKTAGEGSHDCCTHMHEGVVGRFAGVKQEVERSLVFSPLRSFMRTEQKLSCRFHIQGQLDIQEYMSHTSLLWKDFIRMLGIKAKHK